ncbi:M20/M25/M40 family metallo-hydrolase [Chitinophagaceae bacterium LB-8]|uniref:Carboxypeptidase Q n=1 Tax=Paraflavisolibacter caeni TaxID=2982496 RepID=A0A9X2XZY6_9BACT|nr:M20/M25/M40 family metallo-hydrolase [Paraflavisolibacter caeni]MCU7552375.1 M20/M25/M40 family metallo-hydrolase [Paraflavisolibacter caeni]
MTKQKALYLSVSTLLFFPLFLGAQTREETIKKIYHEVLNNSPVYENLRFLCKKIGNRITGSPQAAAAVEFTHQLMQDYGFDTVYLQPIKVPRWDRGTPPVVKVMTGSESITIPALALSFTEGTGPAGVEGEVLELKSLDELKKRGEKEVRGKIVFFNRPFNQDHVDPINAYSEAGNQRSNGPAEAAKYGAAGVLVRSLTGTTDHLPHTGYTFNDPKGRRIPAVAISTIDADNLSAVIRSGKKPNVYINYQGRVMDSVTSYNVVGELRGKTYPQQIIAVGGHLDSWDVGEGAHDDGGGCMQAIELGRMYKKLGIQPQRTIRVVMWMDEEINGLGSTAYYNISNAKGEKHLVALESDLGVFAPLGFTFQTKNTDQLRKMSEWKMYLEPFNVLYFKEGEGGVDIDPLKDQGALLIGFKPEGQRYFDIHHTQEDTFDKVNKRELELGAAAITALIYLIDKDGL